MIKLHQARQMLCLLFVLSSLITCHGGNPGVLAVPNEGPPTTTPAATIVSSVQTEFRTEDCFIAEESGIFDPTKECPTGFSRYCCADNTVYEERSDGSTVTYSSYACFGVLAVICGSQEPKAMCCGANSDTPPPSAPNLTPESTYVPAPPTPTQTPAATPTLTPAATPTLTPAATSTQATPASTPTPTQTPAPTSTSTPSPQSKDAMIEDPGSAPAPTVAFPTVLPTMLPQPVGPALAPMQPKFDVFAPAAGPASFDGNYGIPLGEPESQCSLEAGAQILGGEDATPARYPFMVSLRKPLTTAVPVHYCGATLISDIALLTAAHCAYLDASGEEVFNLAGPGVPRDFSNKLVTPPEVTAVVAPDCYSSLGSFPQYKVFDIQIHPNYTGDPADGFDIALFFLQAPGVPNAPVVKLDRSAVDKIRWDHTGISNISKGWGFRVAGWGVMNDHTKPPGTLQDANVTFLSDQICAQYVASLNITKWQSQLCTNSQTGAGTCKGDSGGPLLLAKDDDPANFVQVGVVSIGLKECRPTDGIFSVFTRVASYTAEDGLGNTIATIKVGNPVDIRSFYVDNFIGITTSRKDTNPTYALPLNGSISK